MVHRWVAVDRMLHDLGVVRSQVASVSGTPSEHTAEAAALRSALDRATGAVHHCLDDPDERALVAAWQAVALAQEALRHAGTVIQRARNARLLSREIRRRAPRREDGRFWPWTHGLGERPTGREVRPAKEDDPSDDEDR